MNISTPSAPAMSSRKRRQTGDVSTIELPTPTTNTTLVNRRTPIQTPTGASAKRISKEEKVGVVLEHLQEWRWSFSDLSLAWLQLNIDKRQGVRNDEAQKKKSKKKKAEGLIATLLGDEEIRNAIMETADIHSELINTVVNILREELCDLQQKTVIFGPWKPDLEFKDIQLSQGYETINQHAPLLCQLMEGLSAQSRIDKSRNPHPGRVVLLTSILSLGRARNSANCFARLLGLHLQGMGVKRRVLSLLHGLGLIDGYRTLNCQKMGLAERSKEGHNTSSGYTRANVFEDSAPINVHS
jgi:hypothetical protein